MPIFPFYFLRKQNFYELLMLRIGVLLGGSIVYVSFQLKLHITRGILVLKIHLWTKLKVIPDSDTKWTTNRVPTLNRILRHRHMRGRHRHRHPQCGSMANEFKCTDQRQRAPSLPAVQRSRRNKNNSLPWMGRAEHNIYRGCPVFPWKSYSAVAAAYDMQLRLFPFCCSFPRELQRESDGIPSRSKGKQAKFGMPSSPSFAQ